MLWLCCILGGVGWTEDMGWGWRSACRGDLDGAADKSGEGVPKTEEEENKTKSKTSPQAKRHQPSLLITSLVISISLTFITR